MGIGEAVTPPRQDIDSIIVDMIPNPLYSSFLLRKVSIFLNFSPYGTLLEVIAQRGY